jgi:hypothetical protein
MYHPRISISNISILHSSSSFLPRKNLLNFPYLPQALYCLYDSNSWSKVCRQKKSIYKLINYQLENLNY